jgi:hypothetical protein
MTGTAALTIITTGVEEGLGEAHTGVRRCGGALHRSTTGAAVRTATMTTALREGEAAQTRTRATTATTARHRAAGTTATATTATTVTAAAAVGTHPCGRDRPLVVGDTPLLVAVATATATHPDAVALAATGGFPTTGHEASAADTTLDRCAVRGQGGVRRTSDQRMGPTQGWVQAIPSCRPHAAARVGTVLVRSGDRTRSANRRLAAAAAAAVASLDITRTDDSPVLMRLDRRQDSSSLRPWKATHSPKV